MYFGLSVEDFNNLQDLAIKPLKQCGSQVWVFGSRARGDQRPFSDIDILYSSPQKPIDIGQISENLENSFLPIKVDLVCLEDLSQNYKDQILMDRQEV